MRAHSTSVVMSVLFWAVATTTTTAMAAEVCWPTGELASKSGEGKINQGQRAAFVDPLKRRPIEATPLPAARQRVIRRVNLAPGSRKLVALTFDLCEQPHEVSGYQGDIVDYLRTKKVRTTFFAGGKWMLTHRTRAEQLMSDPLFEMANHTWEHRNLRRLSGSALVAEIERAQVAYEDVRAGLQARRCVHPASKRPAFEAARERMTLFRFPFGACDPRSIQAVGALGLEAVQWDVSSGDPWVGLTAKAMVDHVLKAVKPGSIVLFHANGRGFATGSALPAIVEGLRAQGYEFATVSELLAAGTPEYAAVEHGCYDSKPGDTVKYDRLADQLSETYARARAAALGRDGAAQPPAKAPEPIKVPEPVKVPAPVKVERAPASQERSPLEPQ